MTQKTISITAVQWGVDKFLECENEHQIAGLLSTHPGFSDKHPDYALRFVQAIRGACNPNKELLDALNAVHSWLVCAPIATPEDMAQSFQAMEKLVSEAIAKAEGKDAA